MDGGREGGTTLILDRGLSSFPPSLPPSLPPPFVLSQRTPDECLGVEEHGHTFVEDEAEDTLVGHLQRREGGSEGGRGEWVNGREGGREGGREERTLVFLVPLVKPRMREVKTKLTLW